MQLPGVSEAAPGVARAVGRIWGTLELLSEFALEVHCKGIRVRICFN